MLRKHYRGQNTECIMHLPFLASRSLRLNLVWCNSWYDVMHDPNHILLSRYSKTVQST